MLKQNLAASFAIAGALFGAAASSEAALFSYYVGVDGQATVPSGEFAGLANPNANRLTFLYAHHYDDKPSSNHYHSKGIYRYQPGTGAAPVIEVSSSNYVPEGSLPPLNLIAGSGLYAGKSVVEEDPANHFSLVDLRDTGDLAGFAAGTGENYMFNSSSGRWNGSLAGADIHLVLVSLSSGLNIGSDTAFSIGLNNAGDEFHLGDNVEFAPVFWTDAGAAPGLYTAQFKLVDEEGLFNDSGTFEFRFNAVPEPSAMILSAGALMFGLVRRRR